MGGIPAQPGRTWQGKRGKKSGGKMGSVPLNGAGVLHSVQQYLSPSMLLQMALFHSFLLLSNILLYICATSSLSIPLLMDV